MLGNGQTPLSKQDIWSEPQITQHSSFTHIVAQIRDSQEVRFVYLEAGTRTAPMFHLSRMERWRNKEYSNHPQLPSLVLYDFLTISLFYI